MKFLAIRYTSAAVVQVKLTSYRYAPLSKTFSLGHDSRPLLFSFRKPEIVINPCGQAYIQYGHTHTVHRYGLLTNECCCANACRHVLLKKFRMQIVVHGSIGVHGSIAMHSAYQDLIKEEQHLTRGFECACAEKGAYLQEVKWLLRFAALFSLERFRG